MYPWLSWLLNGKESTCQCRGCGFDPWVRKNRWRRKWQSTPVFLPGPGGLVHGVAKRWTQMSMHACHDGEFTFLYPENTQ